MRRALLALLLTGCATARAPVDVASAEEELRATEIAFAETMAKRDHAAFVGFLADDAVFFGKGVLRGRDAVAEGWEPYFAGDAPFSWAPERVAVAAGGDVGLSTGPVLDPRGQRVGTFNSTWRRDADGRWKVVLDIGCPPCRCDATP